MRCINSLLLVRETIDISPGRPITHFWRRALSVISFIFFDRGRMLRMSLTKSVNPQFEIKRKLPCEGKLVPDRYVSPDQERCICLSSKGLDLHTRTGGPFACKGLSQRRLVDLKRSEDPSSSAQTQRHLERSYVSILCFCQLPDTPP